MSGHNSRKVPLLAAILASIAITGGGCTDDGGGAGPVPAKGPHDPFPADRADNVPVVQHFSWSYSDTTADSIFYDVYLGTGYQLPLYRARVTDTSLTVGPLLMDTSYRWKVLAYSSSGDTTRSSTWQFSTASSFVFPVGIGHHWEYDQQYISDGSGPGEEVLTDTVYASSTVDILSLDTLSDTMETYVFNYQWMDDFGGGSITDYRFVRDDGMYLYAYSGGWTGPPKSLADARTHCEFKGMRFESMEELIRTIRTGKVRPQTSLGPDQIIEDPPIREIAYPLSVGIRWMYRDVDLGHVWNMEKEIVGKETLTVPAGIFECYKIRWFWDMNDDGEWENDIAGYDYLSAAGIVRRLVQVSAPITIINEEGDTLWTLTEYSDRYDLTAFELK